MKKIAADKNYRMFKRAGKIMDDPLALRLDDIATELIQLANDNAQHPLADAAYAGYEAIANGITTHTQPVGMLDAHGR